MLDWLWSYRKQVIFLLVSLAMIMIILGLRGADKEELQPFAAMNAVLAEAIRPENEPPAVPSPGTELRNKAELSDSPQAAAPTKESAPIPGSAEEESPVITVTEDSSGQAADSSWLININTASVSELTQLAGIGPSKASAIVDYRISQGVFQQIDDIMKVKGIGLKTFEKFKHQITVN
ncbi:helix-hairpin-helix domain-containing protein [Paenibacillus senegalensis]|uniref:helix-hairpin-helix domain-containing protein n=1 Tax=Paenibacillus senegalensis TaxID=1465766 RepID=UPI000288666F|nr:helix-hairpin-helix domain-containing protein [Paenibacillus senegalensis]